MFDSIPFDEVRRKLMLQGIALGATGLLGNVTQPRADENRIETTKIRITHAPSICTAPQYLAEELLRLEGFTNIEYLPLGTRNGPRAIADGRADMTMWDLPGLIPHLDAGRSLVLLAGVHAGCYELFGNEQVRAIRDLKGKTVAIQYFGSGDHVFLSSMLAYVGMDPQKDIKWIVGEHILDAMKLFTDGKADAFLATASNPPNCERGK